MARGKLFQASIQVNLIAFRTYGIVFIARHIESGMFVAIKKFKESDDNEYVSPKQAKLSEAK